MLKDTYTDTFARTAIVDKFDDARRGWTVGAGVEYAITNNLTARAEYRFTKFETFENTLEPGIAIEEEPEFHTVRFGVSYNFSTY
ncbi:outer membrane protein [Microvirga makkahensis]|uniref:outer membrane protein n=1 Tax=Microvirga makkahensis TaxID=1128670 RepID=UPI003CCD5319